MVRCSSVIAVLATLGLAAGSVGHFGGTRHGDNKLRGGHPFGHKAKCCDSMDCEYGYQVIQSASDVECTGDDCQRDQCCEKVCSSLLCGTGFTQVSDSHSTACPGGVCTKDVCCVKDRVLCSAGSCSNGYRLVERPEEKECTGGEWHASECCERMCSSKTCNPTRLKAKDIDVACGDDGWTEDLCCDKLPVRCNQGECSAGKMLVSDASERECMGGKWEESECCDKVCSSHSCDPLRYTNKPNSNKIVCGESWGEDLCCDRIPVYCSNALCPEGKISIANPGERECMSGKWEESECCEKVCSSKSCNRKGYADKTDGGKLVCGDNWSIDLCCDKLPVHCNDGQCPTGTMMIADAETVECTSGEWEDSTCCQDVCTSSVCSSSKRWEPKPACERIPCGPDGCTKDTCCLKVPVHCSDGKCLTGTKMIDDADTTECMSGEWEDYTCCEDVCTGHQCNPDRMLPKPDSENIKCGKDGWTEEMCCDRVPVHCNEGKCSTGTRMIADADTTECMSGEWEDSTCCEDVCTSSVCASFKRWAPKPSCEQIPCEADGCTKEKCCNKVPFYCNEGKCGSGKKMVPDADTVECTSGKWEESTCCDDVCSGRECPSDRWLAKPDSDNILCGANGWTEDDCCDRRRVYCSEGACSTGRKMKADPSERECMSGVWEEDECCEKVCSSKNCNAKLYTDKAERDNIVCGENWTPELCCDKVPVFCNAHTCSEGYESVANAGAKECMTGVWDATECCEKVCTDDVCPDDRYLMKDSDVPIVCAGNKCTKDECCVRASVFCSEGDCQDGYRLIDGAGERECMSGEWEDSVCCEKVCSKKQCPNGYTLMDDSENISCGDNKCSKEECCTKDPVYCNQGSCSRGTKMIANAETTECMSGEWEDSTCCEEVCSSHTCAPEIFTPKEGSANIVCGAAGWTEEECCDRKPVRCSQGSCSGGWRLVADASERECTNFVWDQSECCEEVCTSQTCAPETLTPKANSNDIVCGPTGWTEDLCCDKKPVYCASFGCKDGFTLKSGADVLKCKNGNCTDWKCCEKEPTCNDVICPDDSMNIEDADRVVCENGAWAETQCCDKRCSTYTCPSNCHQKQGPHNIRCSHEGCSTDKCCDIDYCENDNFIVEEKDATTT